MQSICKVLAKSRKAPFLCILDSLERISMHFGLSRSKDLKILSYLDVLVLCCLWVGFYFAVQLNMFSRMLVGRRFHNILKHHNGFGRGIVVETIVNNQKYFVDTSESNFQPVQLREYIIKGVQQLFANSLNSKLELLAQLSNCSLYPGSKPPLSHNFLKCDQKN